MTTPSPQAGATTPPAGRRRASNGVSLGTIGTILAGWAVDLPPLKAESTCRAVDCTKSRLAPSPYCTGCRKRFYVRAIAPNRGPTHAARIPRF